MKSDVAIIGTGGHSRVLTNILNLIGYNIQGYYDDKVPTDPSLKILGKTTELDESIPNYVCAIGDINARTQIVSLNSNKTINWINIVHPFSSVAPDFQQGTGNVICAGAIVQPNVTIGNHCIINTCASVDHDCRIGSFVHLAPRVTLCGTVEIGDGTFVGAGTTCIPGKKIGSNVIIGAGSNIISDIPSNSLAYGNPCRIIKQFF